MRRHLTSRSECLRTLGLDGPTEAPEIKKAYHDLVKVWHPDRFMHDEALAQKAQEKLKEINEAYDYLMKAPQEPRQAFSRPGSWAPALRKPSFWNGPVLHVLALLVGLILFGLAASVYRGSFHRLEQTPSVRSIT